MLFPHDQAMEGAKVAGASRIIGVDLNPAKYEQGTIFLMKTQLRLNR
jgi:Zn-dependent alcohol dehydrogenase